MLLDDTLDLFSDRSETPELSDPVELPTVEGGGVYRIWLSECEEPHYYGGRSTNLRGRWEDHLAALQAGEHGNSRMQATFNKYGVFRAEVLELLGTQEEQIAAEQAWLDEHHGKPRCVNLSPWAYGGNVVDWTPERRKRRSERYKGYNHTEDTKSKMSKTRRTRPDLVEKSREALDAVRHLSYTPEVCAKKGKKAAEKLRGRKQSPENIEKRAAAHRGRKNTPETIALMRESAKRRAREKPTQHGEATRTLISQQQKGRVWINDGTRNQRLFPDQAQELIAQGWVRGRAKKTADSTRA